MMDKMCPVITEEERKAVMTELQRISVERKEKLDLSFVAQNINHYGFHTPASFLFVCAFRTFDRDLRMVSEDEKMRRYQEIHRICLRFRKDYSNGYY